MLCGLEKQDLPDVESSLFLRHLCKYEVVKCELFRFHFYEHDNNNKNPQNKPTPKTSKQNKTKNPKPQINKSNQKLRKLQISLPGFRISFFFFFGG